MGIFKSGGSKSRPAGGKTIIAAGCKINGEIKDLDGALHIDGHIDGVVETDYDVSIGDEGIVTGLIKAKTIVVSGTLEGKVACESIDILATGKLLGEVVCGEMMIESGGKFIGESRELTEGGLIVSFPENEKQKLENQARSVVEMIKNQASIMDDLQPSEAEAVKSK
ncbi:MAG: polymer-forming cytoskeletal protein [Thiomicrospira sp.]|uniref:bactofilin family protein n=1 Tax=Hydrogenovibrio crunogenus TaxID=39765 RepID=UPI00100088E7|nr:polymer-forming cytoskeletal protein [Hydrogenovibrio crunogenus]RUM91118.1 MAG: polymer-forming cytoskeletal protein [Thiomicrospira sp.]